MEKSSIFEHIGYSLDYFVENKFVGSIKVEQPDREVSGYSGRKTEILTSNIKLSNKKVLKKGTEVKTELVQLYGKRIATN